MMTFFRWLALLAPAALLAGPIAAQTAPPAPLTVSGDVTLVTDYRFRGLSRSDRDPAAGASVAIDTLAGAYLSVTASSIGSYVARNADAEMDLTAGYRATLDGTGVDAGLTYYFYPGSRGGATDFAEPFVIVSRSYGPLTGHLGANLAWAQRGLGIGGDRRGGAYVHGDLEAGIPRTPVTVSIHAGHAFDADAATLGRRYTDWRLGAAWTRRAVTVGLAYVDTDTHAYRYPAAIAGARDDLAAGTVLASVGLSF
ncbi:TorF family putative porin [uncultured Sphingomonas sp.]|uniref:TorF family putative porin n=1 Tax=uncultured Sphingomonas sp. TaxID=158754 RepID=UPI0035CB1C5A